MSCVLNLLSPAPEAVATTDTERVLAHNLPETTVAWAFDKRAEFITDGMTLTHGDLHLHPSFDSRFIHLSGADGLHRPTTVRARASPDCPWMVYELVNPSLGASTLTGAPASQTFATPDVGGYTVLGTIGVLIVALTAVLTVMCVRKPRRRLQTRSAPEFIPTERCSCGRLATYHCDACALGGAGGYCPDCCGSHATRAEGADEHALVRTMVCDGCSLPCTELRGVGGGMLCERCSQGAGKLACTACQRCGMLAATTKCKECAELHCVVCDQALHCHDVLHTRTMIGK